MNRPNRVVATGSSPLVRGKREPPHRRFRFGRIIPACAGQTTCLPPSTMATSDHPRLCGANRWMPSGGCTAVGSSPLVRGKPGQRNRAGDECRIIPACAGQTSTETSGSYFLSDHPRLCGANMPEPGTELCLGGSSPLVRGKPVGRGHDDLLVRIIPACAGQTARSRLNTDASADHPRLCGANSRVHRTAGVTGGSSPLVRGKLVVEGQRVVDGRIIPACAGQTKRRPDRHHLAADHPRLCGANRIDGISVPTPNGSSPLVRGKPTEASSSTRS